MFFQVRSVLVYSSTRLLREDLSARGRARDRAGKQASKQADVK